MNFLASIVPLLLAALPLAVASPADPGFELSLREELVSANDTSWNLGDEFEDDDPLDGSQHPIPDSFMKLT